MTREEAAKILYNQWQGFLEDNLDYAGISDAYKMAIKLLEQEPYETIKEILKDYIYDTETKDFLVYRHKYTGHKIYIEKPVPNYKLKQQLCDDAISRQAAIRWVKTECNPYGKPTIDFESGKKVIEYLEQMSPVTPQSKMGRWIRFKNTENGYYHIKCSECGQYWSIDGHAQTFKYCFNCGAKMEVKND